METFTLGIALEWSQSVHRKRWTFLLADWRKGSIGGGHTLDLIGCLVAIENVEHFFLFRYRANRVGIPKGDFKGKKKTALRPRRDRPANQRRPILFLKPRGKPRVFFSNLSRAFPRLRTPSDWLVLSAFLF